MDLPDPDTRAPHLLLIAGSPRRHGNSERLLAACAEGAATAGAQVQTLHLVQKDIRPCTACGECSVTGVCVIFDDMTDLYLLLEDADAIVVASPVYFSSVPAQLKAFYDRCQPFWARVSELGEKPRFPRRPGGFLVVRGGGDPHGFECAVTPTKSVFAVIGVDYTEELRVAEVDAPDDILARPEALEQAGEIGTRIVRAAYGQTTESS